MNCNMKNMLQGPYQILYDSPAQRGDFESESLSMVYHLRSVQHSIHNILTKHSCYYITA